MRAWVPILLLTSAACGLAAASRVPLTGKVTDSTGKPLEHATVMVYHMYGTVDGLEPVDA